MNKLSRLIISVLVLCIVTFTLCGNSYYPSPKKAYTDPQYVDLSGRFYDVGLTSWYKRAVDYAVAFGIFNGTSDSTFEPNTPMHRAMFVTVIARLDGAELNNNQKSKFSDVATGKWYTGAVNWAADNGIINGITENTFEPQTPITREQMCSMLVRYIQKAGIRLQKPIKKAEFEDDALIKSYAKEAVYICQGAGFINGVTPTRFDPRASATRAQIAKILTEFHKDYVYEGRESMPILKAEREKTEKYPEESMRMQGRRAIERSIYNYYINPYVSKDRAEPNTGVLTKVDLDKTHLHGPAYCSGFKLSDVSGKSLSFLMEPYDSFVYYDENGVAVTERQWFDKLKSELGLNVKYTYKDGIDNVKYAIWYMNAGKELDLLYAKDDYFLESLSISRDITDEVMITPGGSSPGVSFPMMKNTMWRNGYRVISPTVSANVLWYNKSLIKKYGLKDPHTMWQKGEWNADSFKKLVKNLPKSDGGKRLTGFVQDKESACLAWSHLYGGGILGIDITRNTFAITDSFSNKKTLEAWEFITDVFGDINFSNDGHLELFEGTAFMSDTIYPIGVFSNCAESVKLDWVPYPNDDIGYAESSGIGMMLPRVTMNEKNVDVAVKFAELWATRYTESVIDNLCILDYYDFNSEQIEEYCAYVSGNYKIENDFDFKVYRPILYSSKLYDFDGSLTALYDCFVPDPKNRVGNVVPKLKDKVTMYAINLLYSN